MEKFGTERRVFTGQVKIDDQIVDIEGTGNGPISSLVDALSNLLNVRFAVANYTEHSLGSGSATQAASYIHLSYRRNADNEKAYKWGVGVSEDVGDSSVRAIFATINNIIHSGDVSIPSVADAKAEKKNAAASGSA